MVGRRGQAHDRLAGDQDRAALRARPRRSAAKPQARDSLARLVDETRRRRLPFSLVLRPNEPQVAPLRDAPGGADARDRSGRTARRRMAGRRRRRRPARPARRTLGRRAHNRPAGAAGRPLPAHCRWRRMRADRRPAGGLSARRRRRASGSASPPRSTLCAAPTEIVATRGSATSRRWRSPAKRPAAPAPPISA